jgi:hypothetical protein
MNTKYTEIIETLEALGRISRNDDEIALGSEVEDGAMEMGLNSREAIECATQAIEMFKSKK